MKIRNFVSATAVVLVGWLGATFLNEVPSQRYPKLDHSTAAGRDAPLPSQTPTQQAVPATVVSSSN